MKLKLIGLALTFTGLTLVSSAQEHELNASQPKTTKKTTTSASVGEKKSSGPYLHVEAGQKKQRVGDKLDINSLDLDQVNYLLKSYYHKVEYVQADPAEDKIAKENGWYDMMSKNIAELEERKKELLKTAE